MTANQEAKNMIADCKVSAERDEFARREHALAANSRQTGYDKSALLQNLDFQKTLDLSPARAGYSCASCSAPIFHDGFSTCSYCGTAKRDREWTPPASFEPARRGLSALIASTLHKLRGA